MNSKVLFVCLLGVAALGYYAYDPELTLVNNLTESTRAKAAPAKAKRAKTNKAKTRKPKATSAEKAPNPAAAPEAVAETAAQEEGAPSTTPTTDAAVVAAPAAPADSSATPEAPKLAAAGSARVADVLAGLPLVKEVSPNAEARYFIYLMSAGWCGPCNQEMPNIVKAYESIKEEGVAEIILVDFDETQEGARAYMDKYGATFPAIMKDHAPALPGIQPPSGIPSAIIVDEKGNMVASGHGAIISEWKKHISSYEEKNGLPSSLASEPAPAAEPADTAADDNTEKNKNVKKGARNAVAKALVKVKWTEGRPNRRAKYFIYYQSASWCGPCCQLMPAILEEYTAMKKDGRVELLHISCDENAGAAQKYYKANKAAFPMVLIKNKGVDKLPGWTSSKTIPHAVIVDATGAVIAQGNGAIVKEWRKYTIDKDDSTDAGS